MPADAPGSQDSSEALVAPGPGGGGAPLEALLALQDLDTAISQLQHKRASLDERAQLAANEAVLGALGARRDAADSSRAELAGRQSDIEARIASAAARRAMIEQRMYDARGAAPRDLQAMSEEISHLRQRVGQLEEEELEVMVALEPVDAELAELEAERAELARTQDRVRAALASAETVVDAELAERLPARAAAATALPDELRDRYEGLRARLGGTGAARLTGSRCSGCHLELPSMEVDRIRRLPRGSVVTCEQCGRILVPADPATGTASPR